jgi:hypothetical protein
MTFWNLGVKFEKTRKRECLSASSISPYEKNKMSRETVTGTDTLND